MVTENSSSGAGMVSPKLDQGGQTQTHYVVLTFGIPIIIFLNNLAHKVASAFLGVDFFVSVRSFLAYPRMCMVKEESVGRWRRKRRRRAAAARRSILLPFKKG
jgi:hypothetical protein